MRLVMSNPLELGRTGAGRPYGYLRSYLSRQGEKGLIDFKFISGMDHVRALYGDATPPAESLEQGSLSDMLISFDERDALYSSDVFLGCGCASLAQMEAIHSFEGIAQEIVARDHSRLITTWFSTHYQNASEILQREYAKVGSNNPFPVDPFLMWRDEKEHRLSDILIVPSEACAETYERDPLCKGKTRVVNFGVDSTEYHPPETKREGDEYRVLFTGGNWVRKGLPYLIRAWNALKLKDGMLSIVGCQYPPVQTHRTVNLGFVRDGELSGIYRKNQVFILPTFEEGQALAVLEAMASGCAVVTTRESGAPIEDGKDGLIIPSGDINAISGALLQLYENPAEREKLGRAARQKAETLTWDKFGEGVLKVCEEAAPK